MSVEPGTKSGWRPRHLPPQEKAFRIVTEDYVPHVVKTVLVETDDWEEARRVEDEAWERYRRAGGDTARPRHLIPHVTGHDASHDVQDGRCVKCDAPDNGCLYIRRPCES